MNNLEQLLLSDHPSHIVGHIINLCLENPGELQNLMDLFFSEDEKLARLASWPASKIGENHPELLLPYLGRLVENLDRDIHDAIIRNTVRYLQFIDIPSVFQGKVYGLCFDLLIDPTRPVAIRVFAMTVCARIADQHDELKGELAEAIQMHYKKGSAGFKARARKILKQLA